MDFQRNWIKMNLSNIETEKSKNSITVFNTFQTVIFINCIRTRWNCTPTGHRCPRSTRTAPLKHFNPTFYHDSQLVNKHWNVWLCTWDVVKRGCQTPDVQIQILVVFGIFRWRSQHAFYNKNFQFYNLHTLYLQSWCGMRFQCFLSSPYIICHPVCVSLGIIIITGIGRFCFFQRNGNAT